MSISTPAGNPSVENGFGRNNARESNETSWRIIRWKPCQSVAEKWPKPAWDERKVLQSPCVPTGATVAAEATAGRSHTGQPYRGPLPTACCWQIWWLQRKWSLKSGSIGKHLIGISGCPLGPLGLQMVNWPVGLLTSDRNINISWGSWGLWEVLKVHPINSHHVRPWAQSTQQPNKKSQWARSSPDGLSHYDPIIIPVFPVSHRDPNLHQLLLLPVPTCPRVPPSDMGAKKLLIVTKGKTCIPTTAVWFSARKATSHGVLAGQK